MSKSLLGLIILFILLTSYTPKYNFFNISTINIQKIIIKDNSILEKDKIKKKLAFLYKENLLFVDFKDIEESLKDESFIESFSLKKIYPNTIKLIIKEKKPIAFLQNKTKKFYISDKGDLINFRYINQFKDLPTVFGDGEEFYPLYKDLQNIKFPLETIKAFYFFESGRWDLIMNNDQIIKLPIENYLFSLKNFMISRNKSNFDNYKIFDYRIKNQLILN